MAKEVFIQECNNSSDYRQRAHLPLPPSRPFHFIILFFFFFLSPNHFRLSILPVELNKEHLEFVVLIVHGPSLFHSFTILYHLINAAQLRYIKEAREIRLAMQPLELIKRVKEIQQEASAGHETDVKQNTEAVDLSKRLKAFLPTNEESSLKALEEWRKRKMERARQRDLEKTGGVSSSKTS
ncbi:uncharacterized protein LOC111205152 [Brassica napus]|uniref:uncharacterized protein LOC111205152 n=1 Tax=Brassica napus TaxID=3708 RepID=UPI002079D26D|nr:uncharacterized protein LOC111205152 [Brassica napus]